MDNKGIYVLALAVVLLAGVSVFTRSTVQVTTVDGQPVRVEKGLGAMAGDENYNEVGFLGGLRNTYKVASIAKTSVYATSTLNMKESGTNYMLSASGTTITLPAVTQKGTHYRFTVAGALDTGNVIIDSAEGDNIDGTLIVAGAVVDCRGEDQINFVVDGEAEGDYVEVMSDGTQWLIVDSGVLTAAKMTCTDPS